MVNKISPVYLLIGHDQLQKNLKIAKIKQEFLPKSLEVFNFDLLYAHDLNLKALQEKLLALPVKAKQRIIVIKEAQGLKEELKKFLLQFCRNPSNGIILILDIDQLSSKDGFFNELARFSQVCRFKEAIPLNTFTLWRQINYKRPDNALKVLNQLLKNGEKPERILGGLRYSCLKDAFRPLDVKNRLRLLIDCDIDIKTGRLKSDFALEKLVVGLCGFVKS